MFVSSKNILGQLSVEDIQTNNIMRTFWGALTLFLILITVVAGSDKMMIAGGGSSLAFVVHDALTKIYSSISSVVINYVGVGSSKGILGLLNGSYDYAGSDAVVSKAQYDTYPDLQMMPFMAGSVVLSYNLPNIEADLILDREVVVGIFNDSIQYWNDPLLVALNPTASLPSQRIRRVVRSDKSGTTEIFTHALSKFSTEWATKSGLGISQKPKWPNGNATANPFYFEGDTATGVSKTIFLTPYSIGYNTLASALELGNKNAVMKNIAGNIVTANTVTVQNAMADTIQKFDERFTAELVDTSGPHSWPIAGYTYFIYKSQNMTDCNKALALYKYLTWVYSTGSAKVDTTIIEKGFAPLPQSAKKIANTVLGKFYCNGQNLRDLAKPRHVVAYAVSFIAGTVVLLLLCCISTVFVILIHRQIKLKRLIAHSEPGPEGYIAIAFTDIQNSTMLWQNAHNSMVQAIDLHNKLMRKAIEEFNGYEVKTEGDSFMIAFGDPIDAVCFCNEMQARFVTSDWPKELLELPICSEMRDLDGNIIFRGLRVRIGLNFGEPVAKLDPTTKRTDYFGPSVNMAARVENEAEGGTTYISSEVRNHLYSKSNLDRVKRVLKQTFMKSTGFYQLQGIDVPQELFLMLPKSLAKRDGHTMPNSKATSRVQSLSDMQHHIDQIPSLHIYKQ